MHKETGVMSMTGLRVQSTDSREEAKHKIRLKNIHAIAKLTFVLLCSFSFMLFYFSFGSLHEEHTCRSAANSHDSPGQEGQDARSPQVHPEGFHKVGGHPVEVDEVAPVVHKVDHNDGPHCFAGQQLDAAHFAGQGWV